MTGNSVPSRQRFRTRVLAPVFLILVALVGGMFWIVNRHFLSQLRLQAQQAIETADTAFAYYQESRTLDLEARFRNLGTDARLRQILQRDDPKTLEFLLSELLSDLKADAAFFRPGTGPEGTVGNQKDGAPSWSALLPACQDAIEQALRGGFNIATVAAMGQLWEVVSVPVSVSDRPGALTFAIRLSDTLAGQIKRLTHSEIVFIADHRVVASTLERIQDERSLVSLYDRVFASPGAGTEAGRAIESVRLGQERFMALAGPLVVLNRNRQIGYLLLYSSEPAWRELRAVQGRVGLACLLGIAFSCGLVWLLVTHVTRPLQALRDGAEAVGRGDLSYRVAAGTRDEFGELAKAFNRMTENLETSRGQLEKTVERLKTTRAQLVQTEKLAGVGEFVAGVTHELNNPLTAVIGFAELLKNTPLTEDQQKYAQRITDGVTRCHKIVRGLLSFARKHKPERKLSQINELLENTLSFVQYEFRTSNVDLVRKFDSKLPSTWVDPNQIQQVFLNMLTNGRQAMEGFRQDSRMEVSTERVGDMIRVTFRDNGPGIAPENMPKLFDPFFTTKEVGKGTGLGLSLSYGIIQEHGGSIHAESTPGAGAAFLIEVPIVTETDVVSADRGAPDTAFTRRSLEGAGKRVLVVDDEEAVLDLIQSTLIRRGYAVEVAGSGAEAVRRAGQTDYDLIVCDWKMPGLNGQQVYEQLRAEHPRAVRGFIFMTGDVINEKTQEFLKATGVPCLAKPFSLSEFGVLLKTLGSS